MYYFNAYNDVIDDFIAIYKVLEMALTSMLYIINDVIICISIIYFPVIYFLTSISFIKLQLKTWMKIICWK